ncbi:alpha-(1-_3)-arabinofuranosyltransferase [Rhodococcus sp. IEGM 1379]|uniref:alpha-(1->3)-arabinofuranosyltransferase n=1 Tax=Rhodococcus sp. IEGM 1379 TaxID=3047086 RepID=UPI0032D57C8A
MPSAEPLSKRWLFGASVVAFLLTFLQAPGLITADTKYDLTQNPFGFLERASHQWSSQAPLGQVQNQAYGYFFPHGPFFALGELAHIPPWMTQRIWWALLLIAGFWGIIRVAEALGVGSRSSRLIAAVAFVLSPRVLTTLGSISSETLPMMLAPWVLLPVILAFRPVCLSGSADYQKGTQGRRPYWKLAAQSGLAVALMGSINAVATAAACLVAVIWWLSYKPNRAWLTFTGWWALFVALGTLWWIVPLLLLGKVSPPFLDYIESAGVTTQWTSLAEILRGTDSWTPFVSPERIAGAVLVTQPAAVVATGLVAAAGLAGLAMRSMPARGRLTLILFVGITGLAAGYVGELSSPISDQVRLFLDSAGAPLRNVHKLEPLVRLPLVLGLAHLLAKVPLPGSVPNARWRRAFIHPECEPMVALTSLILVALTLSTALAWTGKLAPRGAYPEVPSYWNEAAQWLEDNTSPGSEAERALIVPGAPFGSQVWGLTRDEPLQALATTPWAVRDSVPLTPPGAIRALDSVQRLIADGRPSDGLAQTLLGQGIHFLVMRNDLDGDTSRSVRPILVHQAIEGSPGINKVAEFGDDASPKPIEGLVADSDLRPGYSPIEIFQVTPPDGSDAVSGPYAVDLDTVPRVQGGPESVARLHESGTLPGTGPVVFAADAAAAGLPVDAVTVTDTPRDRETDFGQVDNHSSALRTPESQRRTYNLVPDYPVTDTPLGEGPSLVEGQWSGASITVSSSASDATQLGGTSPSSSPASTVDGDPGTGWFSNGIERALGQWLQIDFDTPISSGLLHLTTSAAAIGAPVKWLEVSTPNGSTAVKVDRPGEPVTVSIPVGTTPWLRVTATHTENGSVGTQFGISELIVEDFADRSAPKPVPIRFDTVLPATPNNSSVSSWNLTQEFPGRNSCANSTERVRCSNAFMAIPEEPSRFSRTLNVPENTSVTAALTVRARQGHALEELLRVPGRIMASGSSDIGDTRGSAFAAVDGDPRTTWSASQSTAEPGGPKPTLTLTLPEPTLVTALDITPSLGVLPSLPISVAVNLGNGPQVRAVNDGRVPLSPFITDKIVLSIADWDPVLDQNALGFAQVQPTGLAEVGVIGSDGTAVAGSGTQSDNDLDSRQINVPCGTGPTITIAGQQFPTAIDTTAGQLRTGAPLEATVCGINASALLPAGQPEVLVEPGPAFSVDILDLTTVGSDPLTAQKQSALVSSAWTANHRELIIDDAATDQLIVNPESTSTGWTATAPDGSELAPVVVNGWQQGWIVPAGTAGTIALDFPGDRLYRLGIFGGLVLLIPLLLAALLPTRRAPKSPTPPRPWHSVSAGWLGVLAASTVIGGGVGAAIVVVCSAITLALMRKIGPVRTARVLVGTAGVAAMVGITMLSTGPWRAPSGYVGDSFLIQFSILVALVVTALAALPFASSPSAGSRLWRRFSQRVTKTRAGSSTSA